MAWIWFKGYRVMEKQETTYISKLIPKDLLPLLLQQLWWKGFDEAQKKFPNEDASNVAVRRLIKRMFTEIDVDATRKQIEEEARELLKGYVLLTSPFSDSGFNPSKEEMEQMDTDDILTFVDRVFSLITGEK